MVEYLKCHQKNTPEEYDSIMEMIRGESGDAILISQTKLQDLKNKHFVFEDMLGDEDLRVLMIRTVTEMLDRCEDLVEVRDHYLGIAGQADFTVTAKPAQEMKLYCPFKIQDESQIYETDWDAPYEDDLEVIPSSYAWENSSR